MNEPYSTLFAESGKESLEILQREQIQVIVVDMRMPEMTGLELLKMVKEEYPHIIRVVLSGYTAIDTLLRAINEGEILRFICKPWSSKEEFKTIIRQAIDYYDIHSEREMLMTFFEQLIGGTEPDKINFRLIQTLLSSRKRHLYEWSKKCSSIL